MIGGSIISMQSVTMDDLCGHSLPPHRVPVATHREATDIFSHKDCGPVNDPHRQWRFS